MNDIETGVFEVDENLVTATSRLFEQYPNAQPWVIRIGHRAVDHFGARSLMTRRGAGIVSEIRSTEALIILWLIQPSYLFVLCQDLQGRNSFGELRKVSILHSKCIVQSALN